MKIILLILLSVSALLEAEYPRYKIRGPPYPHRAPPNQQFFKKWHQPSQHPPRGPIRSRPLPQAPVLMQNPHKIPMGVPPSPPRPLAQPVRNFWKNTQTSMKFIPEKVYQFPPLPPPPQPEAPFLAAPSVSMQEFDYHIQTNSIPTHTNPIKQVGEKGPIHTIPAPNLSLRDKPHIVEEVRNEINYQQHSPYVKVKKSHQYQVTELPEHIPSPNFYRAQQQNQQQQQLLQQSQQQQQLQQQTQQQQQLQQQNEQQQHLQQQNHQQQQLQQQNHQQLQQFQIQQQLQQFQQSAQKEAQRQFESQAQQSYFASESVHFPQNPQQTSDQGDIILNNHLSPQELYQLIESAYPQKEKHQKNQIPDYESLLSQQMFQSESNRGEHLQGSGSSQIASGKITFQPEFHSFNYDEQAHQKSLSNKQLASLVSAAYNLEDTDSRNVADQEVQSEVVQNYFEKRSDVVENDVERTDEKSKSNKPDNQAEKNMLASYYSSLPNKEAAERLSQLQAAGKINSSLMKISGNTLKSKEPMSIFMSDDPAAEDGDRRDENAEEGDAKEEEVEYDEYEGDVESKEQDVGFGQKLNPRKRSK